MSGGAVLWIKLVVPLVVHSASKVRLRAAAALEMGMPLLLEKQHEVAAIVEPMMSSVSFCFIFYYCAETASVIFWHFFKALFSWVGGHSTLFG